MSTLAAEFTERLILDGTKIAHHLDRVRAWERGERIAPITIDMALNQKCNYACGFCYMQLQKQERMERITVEAAIQFVEDCAEIGVRGVSLVSDGESTMHPAYAPFIQRGAELGIDMASGTNAYIFDEGMLEQVLPCLTYLRVNFSAGERQRYAEIMGLKQAVYDVVIGNIRNAVRLVRDNGWPCIVNMNLVCDPKDADQLVPFAKLAKDLGVHYAIIKHCAVDPDGVLDVDYTAYGQIEEQLKEAESLSDATTQIVVKWQKIRKAGKREHTACYGPPFALQMSGNGLIAPCGPLFNEKYRAFHIGNITTERFRDMFHGERYWSVMDYIASDQFNPQKRCPSDCMQRLHNDWLFAYKQGRATFPIAPAPANVNFLA